MRGSDERRIAVMLDVSTPKSLELLRWRYGDASAQFRTLPASAGGDLTTLLFTRTDELVEFRRGDDRLEVLRHGAAGAEPIATLGALQSADTGLHGVGERDAGGFWVHWGDHIGLLAPGKPARSFSLAALLPRRCDWGGDIYFQTPDHLWVGIDGRGRDYVRVSLADAEKRAKPWPAASITGVTGSGAEGAVTYAKDPSTTDRLYATSSLRAVPGGGLISIGGRALRRLPPGASRWEVLHEVPGDSLYRVAADDSGRLLASWEKEPVIHFISPAQGLHVSLPKPTLFFMIDGGRVNGLSVDDLEFAANGRDALVFTKGQVGASSRWITAAHWVALDGKSEPRLIFRVDEGVQLLTSRRGAVFAMPKDARQECSHQTCWPIAAIVAYEIAGDRATQRTLLHGSRADMSRATPVHGTSDERVGVVIDLVKRRGPQRLNGGRALLRWRWGDAQADYRTLPGNSSLTPVWLLTTTNDFIEVVQRYDAGDAEAGDPALSARDRRGGHHPRRPRAWGQPLRHRRAQRRRTLASVGRSPRPALSRQAAAQLQPRPARAARMGMGRRSRLRQDARVPVGRPRRPRPPVRAHRPRRGRAARAGLASAPTLSAVSRIAGPWGIPRVRLSAHAVDPG